MWLKPPLRAWLNEALTEDLAQRVALRLRLTRPAQTGYKAFLTGADEPDVLTVLDATLQVHPGWDALPEDRWTTPKWTQERFVALILKLIEVLSDGGSLYEIDGQGRCLTRRVDETVQQATDATLKQAPDAAADHLRSAWVAAYGLNPDADKVFNEAVRAVEEVACPLIEQKRAAQGTATLGTAIGELKNSGHVWELELPGKDGHPRDVESFVAMLETLWQAQTSRHGGAPKSRRQSQEEAEAALHLAVLLVQWLMSGVVGRKA